MNRKYLGIVGVAAAAIGAACTDARPDLSDTVRPNAYGFQFVQAATNLPRGTVRFVLKRTPADATPESVTVSIRGLDSLDTGYWTPWIGDSLGTSFKRATGQLTMILQDTTLDDLGQADTTVTPITVGSVSSLRNGGPNQAWTWSFTRASSGLAADDLIQTFLITIEDSPNATTPNETRRPIWARRGEGSAVPATGTAFRNSPIRFGNWGPLAVSSYLYVVTPARGRGYFQREVLSINDSTLARPPMGYYYALWTLGPLYRPSDTLFLGEQHSPYPRRSLSHYNADSTVNVDPLVVEDAPRQIRAGAIRVRSDSIGGLPAEFPYAGFFDVWLTIEPKSGFRGRMGVNRILRAPVPFKIYAGQLQ